MKKLTTIVLLELLLLALAILLYFTLFREFEYRILLIFPMILIMSTSAVAMSMLYDARAAKHSTPPHSGSSSKNGHSQG